MNELPHEVDICFLLSYLEIAHIVRFNSVCERGMYVNLDEKAGECFGCRRRNLYFYVIYIAQVVYWIRHTHVI